VPASKAALPAPIAWVPCDAKANMPSGCRQMNVDWPWHNTPFAYSAAVDVGNDGKAVLEITRVNGIGVKPFGMDVIADADGPVHTAFLDPRGEGIKGCTFFPETQTSLRQGKHVMEIIDGDIQADHYPEAAIGGAIDELHPKVLGSWNDVSVGHGFVASDAVWASSDSFTIGVAAWGQPWQVVFNGGQAGGLQQVEPGAWHDFVFWGSSDGVYEGVMAWTPEKGAFPFVTFPGDWSRGAEAFGTDGVQMVWIYEEGKGPTQEPYPKRSVMVSPFTKDPKALKPKRLRSFPSAEAQPVGFAVGCGFAAIEARNEHVLVVRLSDGWSWDLSAPDTSDGGVPWPFRFSTVYAVSCDEVFLRAGVGPQMNVARVRLDALGAGMAPD
jgi:hypothetical protein